MSIPTHTRAYRRSRLPFMALAVFAACATIEEPAPPPRATALHHETVREPTPEPLPITPPTPKLEESDAGEETSFKPAPGALPTPALAALGAAPTPEVVAALHPTENETSTTSPEAESLLTHIGPSTPPNVAAAMRLIQAGRQQLADGRYDQALDRFERGVAIDPANAYGYYYLARLYSLMKKYDQASAFVGRAVTLAARSDRLLLARAYGLQGAVFEEVGRYADARKAYQKAVQADPNNLAARVGMGRLGGDQ